MESYCPACGSMDVEAHGELYHCNECGHEDYYLVDEEEVVFFESD